jgi:hypothetical protein
MAYEGQELEGREDTDLTFVAPPVVSPDRTLATVIAYPRTGPQEQATIHTLDRLRDPFVPVFIFAIVFGLSMDYEVFPRLAIDAPDAAHPRPGKPAADTI